MTLAQVPIKPIAVAIVVGAIRFASPLNENAVKLKKEHPTQRH